MAYKLHLRNVGPIQEANIGFGDLTVLVGPQATGKSIFLEFLKLAVDTGFVQAELASHGLDWERQLPSFIDIYFGEGMRGIWRPSKSEAYWNGKPFDLKRVSERRYRNKSESMFFIPAQRVLTLRDGWPRTFADYRSGDPFTVRDFSQKLHMLMQSGFVKGEAVFPQNRRLKAELRSYLEDTVFSGFGLRIDVHGVQKRLVLQNGAGGNGLPFMVWSAGQREFVPLLLGLYWLLPSQALQRREGTDWVIIEEPEMGLHPRAIAGVLLLIFDLLARGYRVCLSTHSPHVLDVVWALGILQKHRAKPRKLLELCGATASPQMDRMAEAVLGKQARVYYFDRDGGRATDISGLDPGTSDSVESGWGGLTEFSGRVADVVAEVVSAGRE